MVKIRTEIVIIQGVKHYIIRSIDMLKGSQLPKIYKEKEWVFLAHDGRSITYSTGMGNNYMSWLTVGWEYTESDFDIRLKTIKKCCDRLRNIKLNWSRNETFLL